MTALLPPCGGFARRDDPQLAPVLRNNVHNRLVTLRSVCIPGAGRHFHERDVRGKHVASLLPRLRAVKPD